MRLRSVVAVGCALLVVASRANADVVITEYAGIITEATGGAVPWGNNFDGQPFTAAILTDDGASGTTITSTGPFGSTVSAPGFAFIDSGLNTIAFTGTSSITQNGPLTGQSYLNDLFAAATPEVPGGTTYLEFTTSSTTDQFLPSGSFNTPFTHTLQPGESTNAGLISFPNQALFDECDCSASISFQPTVMSVNAGLTAIPTQQQAPAVVPLAGINALSLTSPNYQALYNQAIAACSGPVGDCDAAMAAVQKYGEQDAAFGRSLEPLAETVANLDGSEFTSADGFKDFIKDNGQGIVNFGQAFLAAENARPNEPFDQVVIQSFEGAQAISVNADGLKGTYYDASMTAVVDISDLPDFAVGDVFPVDVALASGGSALGIAEITSVTDPPENGTLGIEFFAFAPDTAAVAGVPEPADWMLLLLGVGAAGASLRRRRLQPLHA